MKWTKTALFVTLVFAASCASQREAKVGTTGGGGTAPAPAPGANAIPAGTQIEVELDERVGTQDSQKGDQFTATVLQRVTGPGGAAIPAGATVFGEVTALKASDTVEDPAVIKLAFNKVSTGQKSAPFNADIVETELARDRDMSDAARDVGIPTAAGAILGGVLSGGDVDDALLGGAIGAAAGTAISLGTGDVDTAIPQGTAMTLRTTSPVAL